MLSLQVLLQMAEAQPLLDVCVAMTQRDYKLCRAEDQDEPVLRSDDPVLMTAAGGDENLLLSAREVLAAAPAIALGRRLVRNRDRRMDALAQRGDIERLDTPTGTLHLYRADDIAEPGQITQQIRDSIARAHLTIADITNVNPNVMWELGYADGLGRTIVIFNQNPGSSPFDMVDRHHVGYQADPTADEEENLLAISSKRFEPDMEYRFSPAIRLNSDDTDFHAP